MTQKQKGYAGLGVMLVLAAGTVFGSEPLYKAIDAMSTEKVDYTPGTYVGAAQGFGGEVVATIAVGAAGIESVELSGAGETPAIGGAALEQLPSLFVEANSSRVDAVAGATISSNAAMEAVQQALDQAAGKIDVIERTEPQTEAAAEKEEAAKAPSDASYTPGTYEGTAKGFGGDVKAVVVIGASGAIESVELTGADETPALGGEALKTLAPAFVEANSADVDAVAGCTLSSNGAMEAVQAALDQASGGSAASDTEKAVEETEKAAEETEKAEEETKKEAPKANYVPGTYEGTAKGFGGDVTAKVTIDDSGIKSVELTGDGETPALGGEALKTLAPAFEEAGSADIDGVAGCTVTSNAAMDAVQEALDQAAADGPGQAAGGNAAQAGGYKPGTYEGTAKGFGGDVTAKVTIDDSGIKSVELTGDGETPALGGEALKTLAPAFEEAGSADIDGVAGCTVTSGAAMEAVQAALDQAK